MRVTGKPPIKQTRGWEGIWGLRRLWAPQPQSGSAQEKEDQEIRTLGGSGLPVGFSQDPPQSTPPHLAQQRGVPAWEGGAAQTALTGAQESLQPPAHFSSKVSYSSEPKPCGPGKVLGRVPLTLPSAQDCR